MLAPHNPTLTRVDSRHRGYQLRAVGVVLRAEPWLGPLERAHALVIVSGLHNSLNLLTKLATGACAAGSPWYARRILTRIPRPDAFLFDSLIRASARSSSPGSAFLFYNIMLLHHLLPSSFTFTSLLRACPCLSAARLLHGHALSLARDPFTLSSLLSFYSRSGHPLLARKVFDEMPRPDLVAFNSMISAYHHNSMPAHAFSLFADLLRSPVSPDPATMVSIVSACAHVGDPGMGRCAHAWVETAGLRRGVAVETALVTMYCRCGHVGAAELVFASMEERNVVAWTAMISGYGAHGRGGDALRAFRGMTAPPNDVTFVALLSACAHSGMVAEGRDAMASMRDHGLTPSMEHHVCMVDLLGRAGLLSEAMEYVRELGPGGAGGEVWTAMAAACKMHKNLEMGAEAAERLVEMEPGVSAHYVHLSNVYAGAGRMDRAEAVRERMDRRGLRKRVGWSAVRVGRRTHVFRNGERRHEETAEIYGYLDRVVRRCREAGYAPCRGSVMHEVEEEEVVEYALMYHSEKLAVAYGLMSTRHRECVRVVKNLRMCDDCHAALKFFSAVEDREILVRDKFRFHHFDHGVCSCKDYW